MNQTEDIRATTAPTRKKRRRAYQYPAHGLAVTGFIFALISVIFWGWVPLLAFVGLGCVVIALSKGNFSSVVIFGIALGIFALTLSVRHADTVRYYVENEISRNIMLTDFVEGAKSGLEEYITKIVAKLSSLAS